jgi:streptomycin 6-kinase
MNIPQTLKNKIISVWQEQGRTWLANFDNLLADICQTWQLSDLKLCDNLSYNFVANVRLQDNSPAILKLSVPDHEFHSSINALEEFCGHGIVDLYKYDLRGAILMEKLSPGTDLRHLKEAQAIENTAAIIQQLLSIKTPQNNFKTIADWAQAFNNPSPIDNNLITRAQEIYKNLGSDPQSFKLLHGDLHHMNILAAARAPYLAIDPKGIIGPAEYEVGAFLRNPYPQLINHPDLKNLMNYRIQYFAEILNFDPQIIKQWGFAQAILAAVWMSDDNGSDIDYFIKIANTISTCKF